MARDFLLPLLTYPDRTPAESVTRALDLAATMGGTVATLAHQVDVPPLANAFGSFLVDYPKMAAEAEARSRASEATLTQHSTTIAHRLSIPMSAETITCRLETVGDRLATAARVHDCTLMPIDCSSGDQRGAAEAVLFESGAPIILFGQRDAPVHLEVVVVAWDGGRAAARAVRDALPFLAKAREVVLLTAPDDKPAVEDNVEAVTSFLSRHRVAATHERTMRQDREIGDVLQDAAMARDAGLLVMGGFGHNRVREFVLGGATQKVLSDIRLPIFMSH